MTIEFDNLTDKEPAMSDQSEADFCNVADPTSPPDVGLSQAAESNKSDNDLIRHCTEWRNLAGEIKRRSDGKTVLKDDPKHYAFEVVHAYRTAHKDDDLEKMTAIAETTGEETKYLRIFSAAIIHAIKSVVHYYPEQDINSDIIEVKWPYPVLVHHYDELRSIQETCAKQKPEKLCRLERLASRHLGLLLAFLDEEVMEKVNEEKRMNKDGLKTFDYLWVSAKPGATFFYKTRDDDTYHAAVVHSLSGGIFAQPRTEWIIKHWSLVFNGRYLSRTKDTVVVGRFSGEQKSLLILDLGENQEFKESQRKIEIVQDRIKYGKRYWELIEVQPQYHEGTTRLFPNIEVKGMVMVDLKTFYSEMLRMRNIEDSSASLPWKKSAEFSIPTLMGREDLLDCSTTCLCKICNERTERAERAESSARSAKPLFEKYHHIETLNVANKRLTDHMYLLCPNQISVFAFQTRTWERIHIKNLGPPRINYRMIENLVMDDRRLRILKSLAESFARRSEMWTADFVEGKGNGLIFLLHGAPGVGKTFTAECMSSFLKRPLMVLTMSDIGTNPKEVEESLARNFRIAKSWKAVLLIDEADVFVARRTVEDLERSSLVASFLRALELYDGLLFLTTNRVGVFDDAILSRVHIQLFYPDLDHEKRGLVWDTFINKLRVERPKIRVEYAAKKYLHSAEMSMVEMNGREIRNAFQTAVALAGHSAVPDEDGNTYITEDDLRQVIELSSSFKKYFSKLHGAEGQRAMDRGDRLDKFKQENVG